MWGFGRTPHTPWHFSLTTGTLSFAYMYAETGSVVSSQEVLEEEKDKDSYPETRVAYLVFGPW
jgi:hypothetical protein